MDINCRSHFENQTVIPTIWRCIFNHNKNMDILYLNAHTLYCIVVSVLAKETAFQKKCPVINVVPITQSEARTVTRRPGGGRKRSKSTVEDLDLIKKLKKGDTVERNERQARLLEEMHKG